MLLAMLSPSLLVTAMMDGYIGIPSPRPRTSSSEEVGNLFKDLDTWPGLGPSDSEMSFLAEECQTFKKKKNVSAAKGQQNKFCLTGLLQLSGCG